MNIENVIKRLGKKQRWLLKALEIAPLEISAAQGVAHILTGLDEAGFVEYTEHGVHLSLTGREVARIYRAELFADVPPGRDEILSKLLRIKPEKTSKLSKKEYLFLKFLSLAPRKADEIRGAKNIVPHLLEGSLISATKDFLTITDEGQSALSNNPKKYEDLDAEEMFLSTGKIEAQNALREKAEKFLALYRQGYTYQEIGDFYEITRERVRQILNKTPNFELYLEEYEKAKIEREKQKERDSKLRNIEKSLGVQFPDRVDELWDWEKNGELDPAKIAAHSANYEIWLKCPRDGHSWKKRPSDIVTSWERSGTSGCPVCAGKVNKPQKQRTLTEVYPEFVEQNWDFEKNAREGLTPDEVTLGSNRKVWLKCPVDGNEWLGYVAATVNQQWSKGNAGCRVCNGTAERRRGVWGEAPAVAVKFPEEVAAYWNFEKNEAINLSPQEITAGSSKEAWFKCPLDGHEWQAKIAAIGNSWQRGNSGCPACRGFTATSDNSLSAVHPGFVEMYWFYEKNDALGVSPDDLTCGMKREVWFKCPSDDEEWQMKVNYIVSQYWENGKSGCPKCGRGRRAANAR